MPKEDNLTPFSKDNQPTPEQKSNGWKKKRMMENLATALIKGDALEKLKTEALEIGIDIDKVDFETALWLKQAHKAFKDNDTQAYNAAIDRLRGKPIQETKETGNPTIIQQPVWETINAKKKTKKKKSSRGAKS